MFSNLVTPRVLNWLRNGRTAHILHQFEEVVNLVNDQGDLITVATPAVGPGPFTMIVEDGFQACFTLGHSIEIDNHKQQLRSGHLIIDAQHASIWPPRPTWSRLRNLPFVDLPPAASLPMEIEGYLHQLLQGIKQGNEAMCQAAALGLAGRGNGLTPTGDDVLMGILYGLWVWNPHQDLMALIVDTAVPRTTILSANFIRAAATGEAVWQWHGLVNGSADAISKILAIGHTSGADAWTGFWHTYMALCPNRGLNI